MGIELEIDKGGENNANAEAMLNIVNENDDLLYAKHDGSILQLFQMQLVGL